MDQEPPATFGALLKHYRLAAGLTQEALAERAGISARAVSDLERGLYQAPQRDTVARLSDAFGLDGENAVALRTAAVRRRGPTARTALCREDDRAGDRPDPARDALRHHNLPVQATPFVGREREMQAVRERLLRPDVRMLTLTGTGGAGKTRLAIEAAANLVDVFSDGACLVSLAPISQPGLVPSAICQALDVPEAGHRPAVASLTDYLRDKHLLLLLDNFEQVLDAAPAVAEVLAACPRLKVLVTSRAALHLSSEQQWPVPPLALPDPRRLPELEALSQYDAVALFIQRATAVKPDFRMTNENAPAVAEICARLDGLPLAIELAAARSAVLPPQALLARLGNRLATLTGGARDLPARQQTLRRTIDWSHDLLDATEQALFRRLAVFVGGCALEAAEAVCGDDEGRRPKDESPSSAAVGPPSFVLRRAAVLDGLASLVDKHLLRQEETAGGEPRFWMLEMICEYALERLEVSGEAETHRRRHAAYYLALAEQAEPELEGASQPEWLARLDREHDNLRAVLQWALAGGDVESGMRLAGSLAWYWWEHGHVREGRERLAQLLALPGAAGSTPGRAKALYGTSLLAFHLAEYAAAGRSCQESLAIWRRLGDGRGTRSALHIAGDVACFVGEHDAARARFHEGLSLAREMDDRWAMALFLDHLGQAALYLLGDTANARQLFEEGLAIRRSLNDEWGVAMSLLSSGAVCIALREVALGRGFSGEALAHFRELGNAWGMARAQFQLGALAVERGDGDEARARARESLALYRSIHSVWGMAWALVCFAGLAALDAQPERGLCRAGAASAVLQSVGSSAMAFGQSLLDRWLAPARHALGDGAAAAAWAHGAAMSLEQAIALALEDGAPTPACPPLRAAAQSPA